MFGIRKCFRIYSKEKLHALRAYIVLPSDRVMLMFMKGQILNYDVP